MVARISWRRPRTPIWRRRIDGYIERIAAAAARDPDGYLNTWTQLMAPDKRWGLNGGNDVKQHDVYNAGAMVEAAVHYYLRDRQDAIAPGCDQTRQSHGRRDGTTAQKERCARAFARRRGDGEALSPLS